MLPSQMLDQQRQILLTVLRRRRSQQTAQELERSLPLVSRFVCESCRLGLEAMIRYYAGRAEEG